MRCVLLLALVACGSNAPQPAASPPRAATDATENEQLAGQSSKQALADSGFAAIRDGDAQGYLALMPRADDLPPGCDISARYTKVIPKIRQVMSDEMRQCRELLDWSEAKISFLGYDYKPQPEGGCLEMIGHGDARYRVTTKADSYIVSVEDVMEIDGAFYAFDVPQCFLDSDEGTPAPTSATP